MDDRPGSVRVSGRNKSIDAKADGTRGDGGAASKYVADYLRRHRQFFAEHGELLTQLEVPHGIRGAVSLIEYQNRLMRQRIDALERKLKATLQVARHNERVGEHVHSLTLELLGAQTPRQAIDALQASLREDFHSEFTAVSIFAELRAHCDQSLCPEFLGPAHPQRGAFRALFCRQRPLSGRLASRQKRVLFGGDASQIGSAVLIPLRGNGWDGLVAAASRDAARFQAGMAIDLLAQCGRIASRTLDRWVA